MSRPPIVTVCVRCVIKLSERDYEERITIWHTDDQDEAIEKALAEAREYAESLDATAFDFAQCYASSDDPAEDGAEVFSLIRQSDMPIKEYLDISSIPAWSSSRAMMIDRAGLSRRTSSANSGACIPFAPASVCR